VRVDDFPAPGNPERVPTALVSAAAEVALWWAPLAATEADIVRISPWLSPAEHARAARFGREALSRHYIAGRALLRWLLGRALDLPPHAVPIVRGERGRPQLAGDSGVDFNVSHTAGVALIGIARARRIGVDIERADRRVRADGLAAKFLTAAETIAAIPEIRRHSADQKIRPTTRQLKDPREHGSRGGFSMRAGNNDRSVLGNEKFFDNLGHRAVGNLFIQYVL